MPRMPVEEIFPYSAILPDVTSGTLHTKLIQDNRIIDFQSAFDKCLKQHQTFTLKATQDFFFYFVNDFLGGLYLVLRRAFLLFNHGDDQGPTFLETYSDNIRRIQRGLVDLIALTVQNQSQIVATRQVLRNLLEEIGVYSLLVQSSPELVLARSIDERQLSENRRFHKIYERTPEFRLYGNFEHALAEYQVRKRGLKVKNNTDLVCKLRDEIKQRTSAYDNEFSSDGEEDLSKESEPEDIRDEDGESHIQTKKKRGKKQEPGRFWKHITISRDETSASDFLHERIIILFLKTKPTKREQGDGMQNSVRGIDTPETAERKQQTQSRHSRSREDTVIGNSFPFRTFPGYSSFGVHAEQGLSAAVCQKSMSATGIIAPTDTGTAQGDGINSGASTCEDDSIRCRHLVSRITSLELEIQRLNSNQAAYKNWKIIHFITSSASEEPSGYFDKPVMAPGVKHDDLTLRAFLPVTDVGSYVKQTGLDFVVSRFYSTSSLQGQVRGALAKKQPPPDPTHYQEEIQLESQQMIEALQEFLSLQPGFWGKFPDFDARAPIAAPYIFRYMYRSMDVLQQLQEPHGSLMRMLISWIDDNYAEKYAEADSQLARGVITLRTMPFLTYPGDVLIWKEKRRMKAAFTSSLLEQTSPPILYWDSSQIMWSDYKPEKGAKKGEFSTTWAAEAWSYKFVGEFFRQKVPIELKFKASSLEQEIEISKLAVYPSRFADEKTRLQLENRGRTFLNCRTRNLVSYTGEEGMFTVCEESFAGMQTKLTYDRRVESASWWTSRFTRRFIATL